MANVDQIGALESRHEMHPAVSQRMRPVARWLLSSDRPLIWLLPVVLLLLAIGIYPFVYNIWNSFREFNPMTGSVEPVGFENWQRLFQELVEPGGRVRAALGTTAMYVASALAIEFTLGLAIAVLLNSGVWGAGLWQSLMILPMVVPPTVAAVMFKVLENADYGALAYYLQQVGFTDKVEPLLGGTGKYAMQAVLIPDIWQWTPFFVLILLAGLKALPDEPLEASRVDGATSWQTFWNVTFPMLRPMIAVAVLFRLVDLLKVFDYIFVLTSGGPGTRTEVISFYAYQRSFTTIEWGYGSVLGLLIFVLAIAVANLFVRVFKVSW
ncbi:MAG: sugar ABC transporter permease [Chloroflexia bacterium]|nr:sugar ABC transporter permease [Chloroflexia bacterium]